jgi:uncharacterized protein (TIGR02001 family)
MFTPIRGLVAATLFAGSALVATPALAQEESESDFSISGNASIVSEYRFRGVDLSGGDIAIQGGVDVGHSSGIYIGAWGSSLDEDTVGYGHTELDLYGGWTGEIAEGLTLDVGAIYYAYPNAPAGDFDYFEGKVALGFGIGPVSGKVGVFYAPDQDSLGDTDNLYLFTDWSAGIPGTPISLSAHLGYTDGFLTFTNDGKAWDWSIGASVALHEKVSIGISYIDAEGSPKTLDDNGTVTVLDDFIYNFTDSAIVATLTAKF